MQMPVDDLDPSDMSIEKAKKTLAALREAERLDPDSPEIALAIATLLRRLGRTQESIHYFLKATERPKD